VVKKYLFLKGSSAKKMYKLVSLVVKRPSYSTVKNWVAGFGIGHLSTEDEEGSVQLKNILKKKNSGDPGNIMRKSRLYYSLDFRHDKALSQMGFQMSHCLSVV
jgi:hypothetical protein